MDKTGGKSTGIIESVEDERALGEFPLVSRSGLGDSAPSSSLSSWSLSDTKAPHISNQTLFLVNPFMMDLPHSSGVSKYFETTCSMFLLARP